VGTAPGLSAAPAPLAVAAGSGETGFDGFVAAAGLAAGVDAGFAAGEDTGFAAGEDDGVAPGEDAGLAAGEDDGVAPGEDDGVAPGLAAGEGAPRPAAAGEAGLAVVRAAVLAAVGARFAAREGARFDAAGDAGFAVVRDAVSAAVREDARLAAFFAVRPAGLRVAVRFAAAFLRGVERPVGTGPAVGVAAAPFPAPAGVVRAVPDFGAPGAPMGGGGLVPAESGSFVASGRRSTPRPAETTWRPMPTAVSIRFRTGIPAGLPAARGGYAASARGPCETVTTSPQAIARASAAVSVSHTGPPAGIRSEPVTRRVRESTSKLSSSSSAKRS
jgi:hypothetical protein